MKDNAVIQSPKFEVNLGGIDLSEKQVRELEKSLQQTTLQFLAKLDNGYLKDSLELIPTDTMGVGGSSGEFAFDKRWWFGLKLIKQLRDGQKIILDIPRGPYAIQIPKIGH